MVFEWATESGLDAASSILASVKRSIPHLDETGTKPIVAIDVVDVQNVNLIPLIVTFASVNEHVLFFRAPFCVFHRPDSEPNFLAVWTIES